MADWVQEARRAATRYGVDPRIFVAQIRAESGGREGVSSGAGARDIAQFIPSTARQYGVTLGDGRISDDLDGAARLMRDSLKQTGGDYRAALSIYNSGRPDGYKRFGETRAYVAKIMGAAGGAPAHNDGASQLAAPKVAPQPPDASGRAPGASVADQRQGVLKQYLLQRGRPGSILALAAGLGDVKSPQSATTPAAPGIASPATDRVATGTALAQFVNRASAIDAKHLPYLWGGGHGGKVDPYKATPLDCSGAVSAVLGVNPRVSGEFTKWGKPGAGDGKGVVVYANNHHVIMSIAGKFFGTSASNPGGGAGWIPRSQISPQYLKNFTARHL